MMADTSVSPSTLSYKNRTALKSYCPYDYGRLYTSQTAAGGDVWARLTLDAKARQNLPTKKQPAFVPLAAGARAGLSGYASNNADTAYTIRPIPGQEVVDPPVGSLHRITLKRFKKNYPMDFMAVIRPGTQTVNQSLRMLGTYTGDEVYADKLGLLIPNGVCTGKFHPDVKV